MSRIALVTDQTASPAAADLFAAIKKKVGAVPNLYRVIAHEPAALQGVLGLGDGLGAGSFDAATREAIALAVAGENNCDYCASAHTAISKSLKVSEDEIGARLQGLSADARLEAILTFAKAVVEKRGFVSDDDLEDARAAGLGDGEIIETVANVVANIFTNYVNHVAETEIDFPVVKARG